MFKGYLIFFTVLLISSALHAQGIRKSINSFNRKVKTEINRTNRDVNKIKKTLSSKKKTINPAVDTTDMISWEMKPYIPNSGMIHDYKYVFSFFHSNQENLFSKTPDLKKIEWDSVNNIFYKNSGNKTKIKKGVEVMGWHPHWMFDAYKDYNYDALSIISYYSYHIDPSTGGYQNIDVIKQLKNSGLPDSARQHNVRMFISVTSFGEEDNKEFLNDKLHIEDFTANILALLNEKEGMFSGIDLNFEGIRVEDKQKFTEFVKYVSARLGDKYSVILDVPYIDQNKVYAYTELQNDVEFFNIMGYNFTSMYSAYPGSVAPLRALSNSPSLETAVNDVLGQGILADKIILTLPLYGTTWDITNLEKGGVSRYLEDLPYSEIQSSYTTVNNPYYDPLSASFFHVMDERGKKQMCWYENEISLDLKFKWLLEEKGLKGAGIWALGYAEGDNDIWKAVSANFCVDSLAMTKPLETRLNGPYGIVKSIVRYKKVIGFGFLIFSGFLVLGLLLSLKDWRVREILFQKQSFRFIYGLTYIVLIVFGLKWWHLEDESWSYVLLPMVTGIGVLLISIGVTEYRRRLR